MMQSRPPSDPQLKTQLQRLSYLCSVVVMAFGLVVMVGWVVDNQYLTSLAPELPPMRFNAALCFFLTGLSLWMLEDVRTEKIDPLARTIAAAAALIAVVTLSQDLFDWNLGIDQFFVDDTFSAARPGRMALPVAASFTLMGISLILLSRYRRRSYIAAQALALLPGFFALLEVVGYIEGIKEFYQLESGARVPLIDAFPFAVFSLGFICAYPHRGFIAKVISDSAGGLAVRRLLPVAVAIPVSLSLLRLIAEHTGLISATTGAWLLTLSTIIGFAVLVLLFARPVEKLEQGRREGIKQLSEAQAIAHLGSWEWLIDSDQIRWSDELYRIYGIDRKGFEATFEAFLELVHLDDRNKLTDTIEKAIAERHDFTIEHRIVRPDGSERILLGRGHVFTNADGDAVRMAGTAQDITEQKQAEQEHLQLAIEQQARVQAEAAAKRGKFLADLSKMLDASLNYEITLQSAARMAVSELADWCIIDILDETGKLNHVAIAHIDPEKVRFAQELRQQYPIDPNAEMGVTNVIRTGQPEYYPEITDEMLQASAHDSKHLELLRSLGIRAGLIVPMTTGGKTIGAISLIAAETKQKIDRETRSMAEEFARRAAVAVENSRLFTERTHVATILQRGLLPPVLPQIKGLEVTTRFRPAGEGIEVGGDFYDAFAVGEGRWGITIGDVCGKGVEAATLTALARYTLRTAAQLTERPSEVLLSLNQAVLEARRGETFCTAVYALLTPVARGFDVALSCGGHPQPLLISHQDRIVRPVGQHGSLLGIWQDPELFNTDFQLASGDLLLLYTDGVTEAASPKTVSDAELIAALSDCIGDEPSVVIEKIEQVALSRVGSDEATRDDIAIIAIRVK